MKPILAILALVGMGYCKPEQLHLYLEGVKQAGQSYHTFSQRDKTVAVTEESPIRSTLSESGSTAAVTEEVTDHSTLPESESTTAVTEEVTDHSTLPESESTTAVTEEVTDHSTLPESESTTAVTEEVTDHSTLPESESTTAVTEEVTDHSTLPESESTTAVTEEVTAHSTVPESESTTAVTEEVTDHSTLPESESTTAVTEEVTDHSTLPESESTTAVTEEVTAHSTVPESEGTTAVTEEDVVVSSTPGSNDTEPHKQRKMCVEDKVVVRRAKASVTRLWYAFKDYTTLMRSRRNCSQKHIIYERWNQKMPRLFRSLRAVFNAIYDQYESPFNNEDPEFEELDICVENGEVMNMARKVIEKLPEALRRHLDVMEREGWKCSRKRREVEEMTKTEPKLYSGLRAIYLAVSDFYRNDAGGFQRLRIPVDYNDEPNYDVFEKILEDTFLYPKVFVVSPKARGS